jgi:outer membrane protein
MFESWGGTEVSRTRKILMAAVLCLLTAALLGGGARADAVTEEQGVRLALGDALRTALENNFDLVIARRDPRIAELNVDLAKAVFDPVLGASVKHDESKGEESLQADFSTGELLFKSVGSKAKADTGGASFTQLLDFGGTYAISFDTSRNDQTPAFRSYNPAISSGIAFNWSMPLLKRFGTTDTTAGLVIAKRGVTMSGAELSRQAQLTIESVEDAYWDLIAAREGLDVARKSLKLAKDLYDLNRKKVEVGTLAPIEITQAEAGVASREQGVIDSETALGNAEDNLRRLMAVPKNDPSWGVPIIPADPLTFEPRSPDLTNSLEKAMDARSELKSARLDLENKRLSEEVTRNRIRPQLDLAAGITPSGNNVTGQRQIAVSPFVENVIGGWPDSITEIPKFRNYDWNVGLVFTYPLANREAKANYAIASLNREKADLTLQNVEQTVLVDVRTTVRAVESGVKRVNAARANTVLQRKKLEAEQKKFENGMSTSFEVLTFQTDLANAQLSEIQTMTDYKKALVALERSQGTLLEARSLTLDTTGRK